MANLDQIDPTALGERMRNARTAAGLTHEQAAQELSVARTTVVAIENGSRRIREEELVRLCALYRINVNTILHRRKAVDLSLKFRRTAGSHADEALADDTTRLLQTLVSSYLEVEYILDRPLKTDYPPERALTRSKLADQAEDLALEIRNQYGLGLRPIEDLVWFAESELAMRVFERPLASSISGAFAYDQSAGACVLLNIKHPRARRAVTLAHEIGHLLTSRNAAEVLSASSANLEPHERFCSLFALSLLMPASALRRRFHEINAAEGKFSARNLVFLARSFHVATEAMCRRLEQIGLLEQGTYEVMREGGFTEAHARRVLGEPSEPVALPAPRRFGLLVAEAFEKGLVSEGQASQMLGLDRLAVREILDSLATEVAGEGRDA